MALRFELNRLSAGDKEKYTEIALRINRGESVSVNDPNIDRDKLTRLYHEIAYDTGYKEGYDIGYGKGVESS